MREKDQQDLLEAMQNVLSDGRVVSNTDVGDWCVRKRETSLYEVSSADVYHREGETYRRIFTVNESFNGFSVECPFPYEDAVVCAIVGEAGGLKVRSQLESLLENTFSDLNHNRDVCIYNNPKTHNLSESFADNLPSGVRQEDALCTIHVQKVAEEKKGSLFHKEEPAKYGYRMEVAHPETDRDIAEAVVNYAKMHQSEQRDDRVSPVILNGSQYQPKENAFSSPVFPQEKTQDTISFPNFTKEFSPIAPMVALNIPNGEISFDFSQVQEIAIDVKDYQKLSERAGLAGHTSEIYQVRILPEHHQQFRMVQTCDMLDPDTSKIIPMSVSKPITPDYARNILQSSIANANRSVTNIMRDGTKTDGKQPIVNESKLKELLKGVSELREDAVNSAVFEVIANHISQSHKDIYSGIHAELIPTSPEVTSSKLLVKREDEIVATMEFQYGKNSSLQPEKITYQKDSVPDTVHHSNYDIAKRLLELLMAPLMSQST